MANLTALRESTSDETLPAYAWPGGYPMVYITENGLTICPKCANDADTSDPVVAGDVYWEGPDMTCEDGSQCGSLSGPLVPLTHPGAPVPCATCLSTSWVAGTIESAYGDPDAEAEA